MFDLQIEFGIPADLMPFVSSGFLQVVAVDRDERAVEFHIPRLCSTDRHGYITTYSVSWIRPDCEGCVGPFQYVPGGVQPNFVVAIDTSHVGDEFVDDLETIDDLVSWLATMHETVNRQKHENTTRIRNLA